MPGRERRLDIIFDGLSKQLDVGQIESKLNEERHHYGKRSETNFQRHALTSFAWILQSIEPGSEQNDHDGVDYWLNFKTNNVYPWLGGMRIPAQVKSSSEGVKKYKNCSKYTDLDKKILVIDAHTGISNRRFKAQFFSELKRIRKLLTNTQEEVHS